MKPRKAGIPEWSVLVEIFIEAFVTHVAWALVDLCGWLLGRARKAWKKRKKKDEEE